MRALEGIRVVSLATNVPGPVAAARLRALGAAVVKVEPPAGDLLQRYAPGWYAELTEGQEVLRLDLKSAEGRARLDALLERCDLLLTATRPAALERLGLSWEALSRRFPRLLQVAVTGYAPPHENAAGHDLTYQAALGLVSPPELPRTLTADLATAERAVSAALSLLLARERGGGGGLERVAMVEAAEGFRAPLRHGLTTPGGLLGGGLPCYRLYRAREGWVALAALEPHFRERLERELGAPADDAEALERAFRARSAAEWEAWAAERDLPLAAVAEGPAPP